VRKHVDNKKLCTPLDDTVDIIPNVDSIIKAYHCSECSDTFQNLPTAKNHIKSVHNKKELSTVATSSALTIIPSQVMVPSPPTILSISQPDIPEVIVIPPVIVEAQNNGLINSGTINNQNNNQNNNQIQNSTNINSTNYNIKQKVYSYNNPDHGHLQDKDFRKCINSDIMSVPNLIKKIHFDPNKPENHNLYIADVNSEYIDVYNGKKWVKKVTKHVVEDLVEINEYALRNWVQESNDEEIRDKLNDYLCSIRDKETCDKVSRKVLQAIYDNRFVVQMPPPEYEQEHQIYKETQKTKGSQ
jgi:hypothetical protein